MNIPLYAGNNHHTIGVLDRKTMIEIWSMGTHTSVDKSDVDADTLNISAKGLQRITEEEFNARYANAISTIGESMVQKKLQPF